MSVCLKRETAQAFLDRELPPIEMELAEQHVTVCAMCRRELDSLRATVASVDALMSSLVPEEFSTGGPNAVPNIVMPTALADAARRTASAGRRWAAILTAGALAAASVVIFIVIRHARTAPAGNVAKVEAPAAVSVPGSENHLVAAVHKPVHVRGRKPHPEDNKFIALDDGPPVEDGTIVRINLPNSVAVNPLRVRHGKSIRAEVLVDEVGMVRAIRFLE